VSDRREEEKDYVERMDTSHGNGVILTLEELHKIITVLNSLRAQLKARKNTAELLWSETQENVRLRRLLKDLLELEFPRRSWMQHPSPKGRMLWGQVEKEIR
jgi:hypothetical protein